MKIVIIIVCAVIFVSALGWFLIMVGGEMAGDQNMLTEEVEVAPPVPVTNPLDAKYIVDGVAVTLKDGYSETGIIPGAVSKMITESFGEPVFGDLDGDGDDDALLFLTQTLGGSGTFFFAVVAINERGEFRGTEAVFLGDRISPQTLEIRNGVAIVNYADRKPEDSMVVRPSVGKSKYLLLKGKILEEVVSPGKGESVFFGYWVFGHEVRSFTPCGRNEPEYWVMGDSPAIGDLKETYLRLMADSITVATTTVPVATPTSTDTATSTPVATPEPTYISAYTPLFVVVVGKIVDAPTDGFGADYEHGINISNIILASRYEKCI